MSDDAEWGPWIRHDGRGRPLPIGTVVLATNECRPGEYRTSVGVVGSDIGLSWDWTWWGRLAPDGFLVSRVVRYRVRKPRGLIMLEKLIADLPAPALPKVTV